MPDRKHRAPYAIIVMGVSGSGKTRIGTILAETLDASFADGDDYHPPANVAKMQAGRPLNDTDRAGWLRALRERIKTAIRERRLVVLACSALKQCYRDQLGRHNEDVCFIFLRGSKALIQERMEARVDHFFPPELLQSQFDALEEPKPEEALTISIEQAPEAIVQAILKKTGKK